ncbi:MAG TPA: ABC transporter substrate-binding protein [Dehalococcoidia bacterium]|nr:ABC transporter substrate-binding protein [Dehalococcoidia bacterium]
MTKKLIVTIVALIGIIAMVLPGCDGGEPLPSIYIGSGALDGNGVPVDFFSDVHVRKAFCYAFDYDTYIAEALSGQGVQRGSPVVEGLYGYDSDAPMYEYDLDEAVAEMKLAWDGDAWDKGFKFTLLYNAGNLPRKTACEMVSEKWAYIGATDPDILDGEHFQVSVQALAWPTILGKIFGARDMPMFQIGWMPDYPHADNFIVPFMHSAGTFSYFQGYGDSALDAQIAAAFQDTNPTTQLVKYAALQQRYYDDAPGIVLAQPLVRRYFTQHVTGFYYNPCESSYPGDIFYLTKADNGDDIPYKNAGSLIELTIGDAESLDPAWQYDNASLEQSRHIYETLIYYSGNSTDTFDPILATNTGEFSATNNTLRFTIREGVTFHSGNNMTPEDVEYSFERAMCQDRPGGPIWMFYQALIGEDVWSYDDTTYAAIDASVEVDGQDVVFTLSGAYWELPFKQVLCGGWASIVEKQWCIDKDDWDGTEVGIADVLHPLLPGDTALFDECNGTGPWKLSLWESGVQIVKVKYDGYRAPVPFDNVVYKIVEEWSSRKLSLLAGDADIVYVPGTNFDEMDTEEGLNIFKNLPSLSIDAFFFNMIIGGPAE